ncbi:hypothetical protein [Actinocorallia sp. A-T 12471]|uniref:hypothetical protein n=1 Tax=Actinocorallia sp. A-T 12471 TaxID=3089813 RepID=UPI0029CAE0D5|nr:hypothetical protein [Actinocorallia sp. A-T 12471]MDX6738667.1 hypothetical protein [Actinocorallia sp. A-T 12471]
MDNAARHVLGGVVGLVVWAPLVLGGGWAVNEVMSAMMRYALGAEDTVPGVLGLAVCGAVVGVLCGSRISPLASLVPGVLTSVVALGWIAAPRQGTELLDLVLPLTMMRATQTFIYSGTMLFLGFLLIAASLPPSRWRARVVLPPPLPPGAPVPLPFGGPAGPAAPRPNVAGPSGTVPPPHPPHVPPAGPGPEGSPWAGPEQGREER